jgi:DNA modification methylase
MTYEEFLNQKKKTVQESGFYIEQGDLNNSLFDFQRFIVQKALKKGRYAIFADCGLGKTLMQLEWANQVVKHTNRPVLILAPLAVSGQTINEGNKFDIKVWKWIDNQNAISENFHFGLPRIWISNYEQIQNIDCSIFAGVVLDESSILKNFEGATKTLIIDNFQNTQFKLACTATPSPNDPMELGNHAEFLNVMGRNEMLAMYFVHDGGETSKWRLKGHATGEFYNFVGTWSIMLSKPHDIGFSAKGYDLPSLNFIEKEIKTHNRDNGELFNNTAISATNFNQELRITKIERMEEVAAIVNNSNENFIIWVKQNEEADYIKSLIPDAVEVRGNDDPKIKEKKLLGFGNNEFRVLVTKTKIAQFGLNYQNCRNQIFASLDFSFEGLYQAIRRSYRFGQKQNVNIYLITTDTMQNVIQAINTKQKQFEKMQTEMSKQVNVNLHDDTEVKFDLQNQIEVKSEFFHIKRGDCVNLIKDVSDESIGLSVFSPPFAELYTYSDSIEDMGNSKDYKEFLIQFGFLVKELYRVIKQGRNVAVHCMDLPIQKGKEGYIGLRDFSGMIKDAFENVGFVYHSRVTIWKDPVTEMQRTKALGLLHKQVKKDATMSRVGIPDYVLIFRKDGERNDPVHCNIPVDLWQKYASPVWMDINYSDTLNFRDGRDERDEKHICPLQLPTIERLIHLYSNEGDQILTPFLGIGSEVYQAVKMNRYGIGFELKQSYFDLAVKNIQSAVTEKNQLSLFA